MTIRIGKVYNAGLIYTAQAFFQYAFILCMVLNVNAIWLHTPALPQMKNLVSLLMGVSVAGGVITQKRLAKRQLKWCLFAMGFTALYLGLFYILDPLKSNELISNFLQLLAIIVYCFLVENSMVDTLKKYTDIVLLIAMISLFFWLFGSTLKMFDPTGYLYTSWTGNDFLHRAPSYYGIYFETQWADFFGIVRGMIRNTAIFTEAPMCSFVFTTAFSAELLLNQEVNKRRCGILMAAIISTLSTTGYTAVILAVGLRFAFSKSRSVSATVFKMIALPVAAVVGSTILICLIEEKLGTGSGVTRIDDFAAGFKAWLDAPIFGNGYGNMASIQRHMSSFRRGNTGFSNSPMVILAYGGVYLFIPYLAMVSWYMIRLVRRRQWLRCSFYLVFLYSFIITIVPFQMLTFYLLICMTREGTRQYAKGVQNEEAAL